MFFRSATLACLLFAGAPASAQLATTKTVPVLGASASATTREARFDELGVVVRLWTVWPEMLYQGDLPIMIEVENASGREREVAVSLQRGFGDDTCSIHETLTVAPRARAQRVVFGALGRAYENAFRPTVGVGGERQSLAPLGPTQPCDFDEWPLLYVHATSQPPAPGAREAWSSALTNHAPSGAPTPPTPTSGGMHHGFSGTRLIYAPSSGTWHTKLTSAANDELPALWEAYTSLKGVIVDVDAELPRADVFDALCAWTRLGGCLVLYGDRAEEIARAQPAIAAWFEPRFQITSPDGTAGHAVYQFAHGTLVLAGGRAFHALEPGVVPASVPALLAIARGVTLPVAYWGSPHHDVRFTNAPRVPGLDLPYRALTLLLVCFAIVIGPVNLWFVRRTKRPVLLLVTVPAIALVFSVSIFAYGALAQGLDTRATSLSVTWLDQRTHVASTNELRTVFAGMPVRNGWRPGPGTACFAHVDRAQGDPSAHLELDFRDGLDYAGDFLPVRRETLTAFVVDRAARGRLVVTRGAQGLTVENGLGAELEALTVRAADGTYHVLDAGLAAGATSTLRVENDDEAVTVAVTRTYDGRGSLVNVESFAPGTFFARLAHSPFTDACGVDYEVEEDTALLFGVFDEERSSK